MIEETLEPSEETLEPSDDIRGMESFRIGDGGRNIGSMQRNFGIEIERIENGYLVNSLVRGRIYCKGIKEVKEVISEKIDLHYKAEWIDEGESV